MSSVQPSLSKSGSFAMTKKGASTIERRSNLPTNGSRFTRKPPEPPAAAEIDMSGLKSEADFCLQLLTDGFVQSYVDFYHLTHRADPNQQGNQKNKRIKHSVDEMVFIRNSLVQAETSRRQGNTNGVYTAYHMLADTYKKKQDWKTAIFFLDKCLEVAQLTTDIRAEMAANHILGSVYQSMHEFDTARAFHERHEKLAYAVDVDDEIIKANAELNKVYWVLAQQLDDSGASDEAIEMYEKCLAAAVKCVDKSAEAEANGKIGQILLRGGKAFESLPSLRAHAQISADQGDAEARCRACSTLAYALDSLGENDKALAELKLVHTISEQAGDMHLQSQACRALGTLYSKVGRLRDAMESLERHFELLKAISNKEKVGGGSKLNAESAADTSLQAQDLARVYVGISKGNFLMGAYLHTIKYDVNKLLSWKLNRSELEALAIQQDKDAQTATSTATAALI
jgi:tetratricopeptide (TPR) repeat protein